MHLKFSGNRALILGGNSELGICLAKCLINTSLFPILTYRNETGHRHILDCLQSVEGKYSSFHLDFGDPASLDSLFRRIGDNLDFLVDFAHANYESLVASADEERLSRYFAENISFRAAVLKRAARAMLRNKRGRLVFISSSAAKRPNPGQGFYAAAKLASEALYKNLGLELGERGITTVTLRPGYIDAGRGRAFIQAKGEDALKKVPTKKALAKEEVAETILFYLSDSAEGTNATEISMDGGLTAGK